MERALRSNINCFDFMQLGWEANITRLPLGVVGRGLWGGEHKAVHIETALWEGEDYESPLGLGGKHKGFFFFSLFGG